MVVTHEFHIACRGFCDMHNITDAVSSAVRTSELESGIADSLHPAPPAPSPPLNKRHLADFEAIFERIAAQAWAYKHNERWHSGNGFSHVRAALLGPSLTVPFSDRQLILGTWQDHLHRFRQPPSPATHRKFRWLVNNTIYYQGNLILCFVLSVSMTSNSKKKKSAVGQPWFICAPPAMSRCRPCTPRIIVNTHRSSSVPLASGSTARRSTLPTLFFTLKINAGPRLARLLHDGPQRRQPRHVMATPACSMTAFCLTPRPKLPRHNDPGRGVPMQPIVAC
ncbi:MAG: YjbQ family protein [Anaerolineaceae bacterium]|nr:YjbQ family protein [Anaerolineaceae bacterium]